MKTKIEEYRLEFEKLANSTTPPTTAQLFSKIDYALTDTLRELRHLFEVFKGKHEAGGWIEINALDFEKELEYKIIGKGDPRL